MNLDQKRRLWAVALEHIYILFRINNNKSSSQGPLFWNLEYEFILLPPDEPGLKMSNQG